MTLVYTRHALRRLNQIQDYHGGNGNPAKGIKEVDKLLERALLLEKNPLLGQVEEHFEHLNLGHRSLVVGKYYKIVYRIDEDDIIVTDVFSTRRSTDEMRP